LAAREKGIDLKGAKFITVGGPLTAAKRKEIEAAGAAAMPIYGYILFKYSKLAPKAQAVSPFSKVKTRVFSLYDIKTRSGIIR
jgi:hypothetical protein